MKRKKINEIKNKKNKGKHLKNVKNRKQIENTRNITKKGTGAWTAGNRKYDGQWRADRPHGDGRGVPLTSVHSVPHCRKPMQRRYS